jgi:hypothetical protein
MGLTDLSTYVRKSISRAHQMGHLWQPKVATLWIRGTKALYSTVRLLRTTQVL